MLFRDCGCCECHYRLQVLPAGFSGAVVNDDVSLDNVDLFIRSASYELYPGEDVSRPPASATPISVRPWLELITDEDFVELKFIQSEGHVLRMTYEGENLLLDSDDSVTLTIAEDTLDDEAWPEDPLGRDYLDRSGATWEVRIVKPLDPCRCRVCYCGQDDDPVDLEGAPEAYTLDFVEGFTDPESASYGPELPNPRYRFAPHGDCPATLARWADPFSLRKLSRGEQVEFGFGEESLVYVSEAIPFQSCYSPRFFYFPCSTDGLGALCVGTGIATGQTIHCVFAATGTRTGWKFSDYRDTPEEYRTDLFTGPVDFGIATVTPAEEHTPFEIDCPAGADGVSVAAFPGCLDVCPTEMTVEIYAESCAPFNCNNATFWQPTNIPPGGQTYTLSLDPELCTDCTLVWTYAEEEADPNLGTGNPPQPWQLPRPVTYLKLTCYNATEGTECNCDGGVWRLEGSGLSEEYISGTDQFGANITSRMPWSFGQTYMNNNQLAVGVIYPFLFSDGYASGTPACYSPCEEGLELDQPEEHIAAIGNFARPGRLQPLSIPAVSVPYQVYPGIDPATGFPFTNNGYKGYAGYKITPG